jgi:ribosomal protein L37AE/L43A
MNARVEELAIWRAVIKVCSVEEIHAITTFMLSERASERRVAPELSWWEKENAATLQEFHDYAHRFGCKPGGNVFDFVMHDAMAFRDQQTPVAASAPEQSVMKCRSCEATTDKFEPYAACGRCGGMLVDKVAPEQETATCSECGKTTDEVEPTYIPICGNCDGPLTGNSDAPAPVAQDAVSEALDVLRSRDDFLPSRDGMTAALRTAYERLREVAIKICENQSRPENCVPYPHQMRNVLERAERELLGGAQ